MSYKVEVIAVGRNDLAQFADSDGIVRFDFFCDDDFVAITKRIDDTNDPGKLRQDVVSSLRFPITKKNIAIIGDVGSPNAFNRIHSKPITVSVRYGMYCLEATQLVFTTTGDVPYEAEIFGTANEWINAISKIKLSDIDCGIIPSYDWEFINDRHENFWTWQDGELPVFPPYANYGRRKDPNCVSFSEMRLWLSPLFLLREGFCLGGYKFVCPMLEGDYGRRLWIYVLREKFDEQGQETQHAFSANLSTDITLTSAPINSVLIFDNDTVLPAFDNGNHYDTTTGVFSGISMRGNFIIEIVINVTSSAGGFSLFSAQLSKRDSNGITFGLQDSQLSGITDPGIYTITVTQENLLISETDELFVTINAVGLSGSILANFTKFRNEPKAVKLQQGDTVEIAKMINSEYTVLGLLRGVAHLFNLKPEFDQITKEVRFFPSDGADLYEDGEQEAYFFPNSEAKNWTKKIHKKSLRSEIGRRSVNRNFSLEFKKDNGDYKVGEVTEPFPLHASNEDFSDCFPEGTKKSPNPFFAATINDFDFAVRYLWGNSLFPDTAPWLPFLWKDGRSEDGEDPDPMLKITPRIVLSYPYGVMIVPEYAENGQDTQGNISICDDASSGGNIGNRQYYSPVAQIMPNGFKWRAFSGGAFIDYDGTVVYGTGDYNDNVKGLYEIVYRQSIKRLYYSALLEFLVKLELLDFVNFNPRCKFFIRYQSRTLGELLFYARIVEITDYVLNKRILTPIIFEPDANYFELECPCECDYRFVAAVELGTELIPSVMVLTVETSEGCGDVTEFVHDIQAASGLQQASATGVNTEQLVIQWVVTSDWLLRIAVTSPTACGDQTSGLLISGTSTTYTIEQL